MSYIWESSNWPEFFVDMNRLEKKYQEYIYEKGRTDQIFSLLSPNAQKELFSDILASGIVSSNEIEGISVSYDSVYSSILRALNIECDRCKSDKNSEALASLALSAHNTETQITEETILSWHKKLFEYSQKNIKRMNIGKYRERSVAVMRFSGKMEEEVMYEAVPPERVKGNMARLISWINSECDTYPLIVKSALASLWFVTIHPFDDGNGRITRLLGDAILREESISEYYSSSSQIQKRKQEYYSLLYTFQHSSTMDATDYVSWFLDITTEGIKKTEKVCRDKIKLAGFMASLSPDEYNSREISMLYKLASGSFKGKLTPAKWCKMNKCQSATATRDLSHLCEKNLLLKSEESGRSSWYALNPGLMDKEVKVFS